MSMFLGVDGGGTKTSYCIVNDRGVEVAFCRMDSIYYLMDSIDIVEPLLKVGIAAACGQAGVRAQDLEYAFFGIPCFGEVSSDVARLKGVAGRAIGHDRYRCDNDVVCGWAGSLGATDGIGVVSGTGSIAYGEFIGRRMRAGGWGETFGDEGSAYWASVQGLNAFSRMCDGRLPIGPLVERIHNALGITHHLDVVDIVLNRWHSDRSRVAGLGRVLDEAAADGDDVSRDILRHAGEELALLVKAIADGLGFEGCEQIPLSFSGGMFKSAVVLSSFRRAVDNLDRNFELRNPLLPPEVGAAMYAARLAGQQLDPATIQLLPSRETPQEGQTNDIH